MKSLTAEHVEILARSTGTISFSDPGNGIEYELSFGEGKWKVVQTDTKTLIATDTADQMGADRLLRILAGIKHDESTDNVVKTTST